MSGRRKDEDRPERVHHPDSGWDGLTDAQIVVIAEGAPETGRRRLVTVLRNLGSRQMGMVLCLAALVCIGVISARDGPESAYMAVTTVVAIAALAHGKDKDRRTGTAELQGHACREGQA